MLMNERQHKAVLATEVFSLSLLCRPLSLVSLVRPTHLEVCLHRELLERSRVRQALRDDLAGEVIYEFDQKLSHPTASPLLYSCSLSLSLSGMAWCWLCRHVSPPPLEGRGLPS